eukprot:TRINITY_DN51122_c0_g1_i1.p1 TRINITY_DN51122_c0_g1~~TRINITY_DN51122_c0_g1_i1.p1  ORF type:complete len:371 (+),score=48.71 TRINITY_DN51122_c0_g1_i1:83-1195(+)
MALPVDNGVLFWLGLLFLSAMGEAYFPDIMKLNSLQAQANWCLVADALGNLLAGVVPTEKGFFEIPVLMAAGPAFADIFAKAFLLGGMALADAQAKSILYNSCIVWSALLSRFVIGRILSLEQWGAIGVLILGLFVKIDFSSKSDGEENSTYLLGMISILIGCALHSLTNVLNEYFIRKYDFPPSKLCSLIGLYSFSTWLLFFSAGYIMPEFKNDEWHYHSDYLNLDSMGQGKSYSPLTNGWAWFGFVVCSAIHAVAYYNLLGSIGVVSVGVTKGLTTAGYVMFSGLLLCGVDPKTPSKWCVLDPENWRTSVSALVCVIGVGLYTFATSRAHTSSRAMGPVPSAVSSRPSSAQFFEEQVELKTAERAVLA